MGKAVNMMLGGKKSAVKNIENGPTSTGSKGIPEMLKIKDAGSKPSPGVEKTVNLS